MRLVAIYIKEHEYLFDKPQTINFGGKFLYSFEEKNKEVIVSRKENEQFIDDFFNIENDTAKITMISAVVGQNGSGKSSLMDVIRSQYIEYRHYHYEALFLFEDDNMDYPSIHNYGVSDRVLLRLDESNENFEELTNNEQTHQSIYYSPQFDYKFNVSFDNTDSYDLSFDKYLELDLKELSGVSADASGWSYTPSQELLFKNSLRQIEFLSSDLVKERSIFNNIFSLPEHGKPLLTFRGYKSRDYYHQAINYSPALKRVDNEIFKEIAKWRENIGIFNEKGRTKNKVEVNKYLIKRYVLRHIISVIGKQIERDGSNYSYDSFNHSLFEEEFAKIESSNEKGKPLKYLSLFIELCELIDTKGEKIKTFDVDIFKNLIGKLYKAIDSCSSEKEVDKDRLRLYCTKEQAIEILTAQREFLSDLFLYYHKRIGSSKLTDEDRIDGFVHYMPFRISLSSGENALLNLFSKLFTFLKDNFVTDKFLEAKDHYILILDEGDLGFHPTWKKKYIYSLCKTLPYFFDLISEQSKPTFQIIITTHDSLTLSDLPNSNVVYMESCEGKTNVLDYDNKNRPTRTFGANITDLLADSFFIKESLVGKFANEKISNTIEWLNDENRKEESDKFKTIIDMIDEPILQRKLGEMYDEKMGKKLKMEIIDKQIEYLEKLKEKLN